MVPHQLNLLKIEAPCAKKKMYTGALSKITLLGVHTENVLYLIITPSLCYFRNTNTGFHIIYMIWSYNKLRFNILTCKSPWMHISFISVYLFQGRGAAVPRLSLLACTSGEARDVSKPSLGKTALCTFALQTRGYCLFSCEFIIISQADKQVTQ